MTLPTSRPPGRCQWERRSKTLIGSEWLVNLRCTECGTTSVSAEEGAGAARQDTSSVVWRPPDPGHSPLWETGTPGVHATAP
jgi:hypothetical protein